MHINYYNLNITTYQKYKNEKIADPKQFKKTVKTYDKKETI